MRLGLIAVAVILSTAFFALLPRRTHWWTHFGQYTMYVYLLHSFVLYPFRESGVLSDLEPTWLWLPIVVVAAVLIALGLATKPVRRLFRPLVEPRPMWLFADATLAGREGHRSDPDRVAQAARSSRERCIPIRGRTADSARRRRAAGQANSAAPTYEPAAAPGGTAQIPDRT